MKRQRLRVWLATLGISGWLLVAALPAGAAHPAPPSTTEVQALGPAHAAEHAALRERAQAAPAEPAVTAAPVGALAETPADVGRWLPKFSIPGVAVHAVMLRTGKVLYFTGTTSGRAFLLDPATGTTKAVYPPRVPGGQDEPANIFCAGQSFLDDGTVLVMGGTVDRREGLDTIYLFDPVAETWKLRGRMRHGRWYPSQVLLADGRTVVIDGLDEQGEPHVNQQIESYNPNLNFTTLLSVRGQTGQPPPGGLYPHLFQMPSGRVLVAGPEPADSWFFRLNGIGALSWEDAANPTRHTWGTGVLLPAEAGASTRVALVGGVDRDSLPDSGSSTPLTGVETFDEADPAAGWSAAPPLNHGRAHHNTVLLPDGSMVTVGGGYGILNGNRRSGDPAVHRNIELYDPATGQWRLGPAQDELRTYHSTALLLPDARVLSAGDDGYGGTSNDTAEIYEPPYLFKGPRPAIESAPASVDYGETFTVEASDDAARAVMMAPGAVTHANDMSQRTVPLAATVGANGTMTVTAPPSPEVAPPTYYMLFVLNDAGVPSVAKFVRVKEPRPDPPTDTTPPDTEIVAGPPLVSQSTSATFEFDATEVGATFACALDAAQPAPCTSPVTYSGLDDGAHSFEVTATDAAGNADPSPAVWSWTVASTVPDTTPPETSITDGPAASTELTETTFEFTSSEPGSTFACLLDDGAWSACSSPATYTDLAPGPHTFAVTATDAGGNSDQSPAEWTWAVEGGEALLAPVLGGGPLALVAAGESDSTAPALKLRTTGARRAVRQRRIVVEAGCPAEACTTTAQGRIVVAGSARALRLVPAALQIAKGGTALLHLRFSPHVARTLRRALRAHRLVRVKLSVTATDAAGNVTTSRRTLRLA